MISKENHDNLYKQDTDLEIIRMLIPYIKNKSFLDIGAEKGEFTKFLSSHGFEGICFEPLPNFAAELNTLAASTNCRFLSYAIDESDRTADFYTACDHADNAIEQFSSLHPLSQDQRIIHKKVTTVTCRSLNSLLNEGIIKKHIGFVKIDTEGNDLNVLKGMHEIEVDILMCEYFMPGIYSGWTLGHPHGLIEEAKRLGFNHYIAIKRINDYELVAINSEFTEKQWGNIIFLKDPIYHTANNDIKALMSKYETNFFESLQHHEQILKTQINTFSVACEERLNAINLLTVTCEERLKVINVLDETLQLYRRNTDVNQFFFKNLRYFRKLSIIYNVLKLKDKILASPYVAPRIGKLYQHPPKPFRIPKKYKKNTPLKTAPLISIVTPSYNQKHFLEKTIKSIITQNYPALEYIIQDGASTDDSVKVIKRYQSLLKHWESKKDRGQSHALNLGFKHATGEIMAYLNSDDILFPGALNYIAHYFDTHPDVDVVYGHRILIDKDDYYVGRWILPPHDSNVLDWADYIPQESLFWRKRIWDKVGGTIDESFRFAMDWDLLLRFKEAGATFVRLPRILGAFRVHIDQKTSAQIGDVGLQEMERLRTRTHKRDVTRQEIRENIRGYLFKHFFYDKLYRLGILRY